MSTVSIFNLIWESKSDYPGRDMDMATKNKSAGRVAAKKVKPRTQKRDVDVLDKQHAGELAAKVAEIAALKAEIEALKHKQTPKINPRPPRRPGGWQGA